MRSGRTVDAAILSVQEFNRPGVRGGTVYLEVQYRFTDAAGHVRQDTDNVPTNWTFPEDPSVPVPIQYLADSPQTSRLAGHTNRFWMLMLVGLPLFIAGHAVWYWWIARR